MISDVEMLEFLKALDNAEDVHVSGWEASFLESIFSRGVTKFSEKQREVIAGLMDKYPTVA